MARRGAETFVRENGYTEQPADDSTRWVWEQDDADVWPRVLAKRSGRLNPWRVPSNAACASASCSFGCVADPAVRLPRRHDDAGVHPDSPRARRESPTCVATTSGVAARPRARGGARKSKGACRSRRAPSSCAAPRCGTFEAAGAPFITGADDDRAAVPPPSAIHLREPAGKPPRALPRQDWANPSFSPCYILEDPPHVTPCRFRPPPDRSGALPARRSLLCGFLRRSGSTRPSSPLGARDCWPA